MRTRLCSEWIYRDGSLSGLWAFEIWESEGVTWPGTPGCYGSKEQLPQRRRPGKGPKTTSRMRECSCWIVDGKGVTGKGSGHYRHRNHVSLGKGPEITLTFSSSLSLGYLPCDRPYLSHFLSLKHNAWYSLLKGREFILAQFVEILVHSVLAPRWFSMAEGYGVEELLMAWWREAERDGGRREIDSCRPRPQWFTPSNQA